MQCREAEIVAKEERRKEKEQDKVKKQNERHAKAIAQKEENDAQEKEDVERIIKELDQSKVYAKGELEKVGEKVLGIGRTNFTTVGKRGWRVIELVQEELKRKREIKPDTTLFDTDKISS